MSFRAWQTRAVRPLLAMLALAAALTFLVACANLAGLLLAEGVKRGTELAIRSALGATAGQVAQIVILRSIVWTLPGGLLGFYLSFLTLPLLGWWMGVSTDDAAHIGAVTLSAGAAFVAAVIALVSAAVAAWGLRHRDVSQALREGGIAVTAGHTRSRAVLALLALQVSAAVALSINAALLVRTVWVIGAFDYGFDLHRGFVVELRLPRSQFRTIEQQAAPV